MPIEPGQTLLHYRIVDKLGEGGMGAVWRAVDTTLDREVAIKVLPVSFATDPERLARFEREAKLLASLNHANIATIHGMHETDGVRFIAMEIVPGADLTDRISRGPLPVDAALGLARQFANALAAAHTRGVVHRDLKPANIRITPEGGVKVLDFGLAKAVREPSDPAAAPTMTSSGTVAGVILGTAAYMSPEQARGDSVDRRADVWGFGCVLYEMLSGQKAFAGATVTDILAAVLREDPDWNALPDHTPSSVRRLLRRCLEKDPERRLHDIADARIEIDDAESEPLDSTVPSIIHRKPSRRAPALIAVALVLVGLALAFYLGRTVARPSLEAPSVSYERLTFRRGQVHSARFDPAGQNVFYTASWEGEAPEVFATRPGSGASRPLNLADADIQAVSGEGEFTILKKAPGPALYKRPGTVAISSLAGGLSRDVMEDVLLVDRTADGELAVMRTEAGRQRVEYPLGKTLYETKNDLACLRVSPDGSTLALGEKPQGFSGAWLITFVGRDGLVHSHSTEARGDLIDFAWSPDGREIWFNTLLGGKLDLYALSRSGERRLLVSSPVLLRIMDVSRDGDVLVARTTYRFDVTGVAPTQTRERNYSWLDSTEVDAITPDGSTLLLTEFGEGGNSGTVFLRTIGRDGVAAPAVRLGEGQAHDLSPDGAWALTQTTKGPPSLVLLPTGAGSPISLETTPFVDFVAASFTPDGKQVLFAGVKEGGLPRYYLQSLSGGAAEPVTPEIDRPLIPGALVGQSPIAPDGRTVAAFGHDDRLTLYPVDGGSPKAIDGLEPGLWVEQWSADGRFLYVREVAKTYANIYRVEPATGRSELWKKLGPEDPTGFQEVYSVHIADDEESYYYTISRVISDLYLVRGLR